MWLLVLVNGQDVRLGIRERTLVAVNIAIKPKARIESLFAGVVLCQSSKWNLREERGHSLAFLPHRLTPCFFPAACSQCLSSPIFQARVCCLLIINSPTTRPESQRFAELEPSCPTLSISLKGWAKPLLYVQCHHVLKPLLLRFAPRSECHWACRKGGAEERLGLLAFSPAPIKD